MDDHEQEDLKHIDDDVKVLKFVVLKERDEDNDYFDFLPKCINDTEWFVCMNAKQKEYEHSVGANDDLSDEDRLLSLKTITTVVNPSSQKPFHDPLLICGSSSVYIMRYDAKRGEDRLNTVLTEIAGTWCESLSQRRIPVHIIGEKGKDREHIKKQRKKFRNCLEIEIAQSAEKIRENIETKHLESFGCTGSSPQLQLLIRSIFKRKATKIGKIPFIEAGHKNAKQILQVLFELGVVFFNNYSQGPDPEHLAVDPMHLFNLLLKTVSCDISEQNEGFGVSLDILYQLPQYEDLLCYEHELGLLLLDLGLVVELEGEYTFIHTLKDVEDEDRFQRHCTAGPLIVTYDKPSCRPTETKFMRELIRKLCESNRFELLIPQPSYFVFEYKRLLGGYLHIRQEKGKHIEIVYDQRDLDPLKDDTPIKWPLHIHNACKDIERELNDLLPDGVVTAFKCTDHPQGDCISKFEKDEHSCGLKCSKGAIASDSKFPWEKRIWHVEPGNHVQAVNETIQVYSNELACDQKLKRLIEVSDRKRSPDEFESPDPKRTLTDKPGEDSSSSRGKASVSRLFGSKATVHGDVHVHTYGNVSSSTVSSGSHHHNTAGSNPGRKRSPEQSGSSAKRTQPGKWSLADRCLFMSHSSKDKDTVDEIVQALRQFGINVWYDKDEIRTGHQWDTKISEDMQHMYGFICCMSEDFFDSEICKRELQAFMSAQKDNSAIPKDSIFPVIVVDPSLFKGVRVNWRMALPAQIHYKKWTVDTDQQLFLKDMKDFVNGSTPTPSTSPAGPQSTTGLGTNDSDSTPSFSKNGTRKKVTRKVKRKKSAASKKIGGTSSKNTARKTSQPARRSIGKSTTSKSSKKMSTSLRRSERIRART